MLGGPGFIARPIWPVAQQPQPVGHAALLERQRHLQHAPHPLGVVERADEQQFQRRRQPLAGRRRSPGGQFVLGQRRVVEGVDVGRLVGPAAVDRHHAAMVVGGQPAALDGVGPRLRPIGPPVAGVFDPTRPRSPHGPQQGQRQQADVGRAAHVDGVGATHLVADGRGVGRVEPGHVELLAQRLAAGRGHRPQPHPWRGVTQGAARRVPSVDRGNVDDLVEQLRQVVQLAHGRPPADKAAGDAVVGGVGDDE